MKNKIKKGGFTIVEAGALVSASFEALKDAVFQALLTTIRIEASDATVWCWIQNMYATSVVYSIAGEYYQRDYTVTGEDVKFGAAVEVEMAYTPVAESAGRSRVMLGNVMNLVESYDATKGELTMTVIKPGFNSSKGRYYPAATLKRDFKIFEGAKMFADHQSDAEERNRPEDSVHRWVANVTRCWAESDGRIRATAVVVDPPFKAKLEELAKNDLLKEMGISIRAIGEAHTEVVETVETNYIDSILRARSVDFVTYAGAGGQVEVMESNSEDDVDLMTEAQLRERRPDLIKLVESKQEQSMKTAEQQLAEANAAIATEKKRADDAEAKIAESETKAKKATAATELAKLLSESKLPEASQTRLKKQFENAAEVTGMKEAIVAELEYVKTLTDGKGVTNMGESENGGGTITAGKPNLVESYKKLGLSEAEAKIAATGKRAS